MPENKEKLIEIAKLVGFQFDQDKLRQKIRKYSKHPKMIGIAALFKSNNMSYVDEQNVIKIDTPKGTITIPKDGQSDGYRLQEAVVEKCRGGKNIIALPALSGVMSGKSNAIKWAFKEAWDCRALRGTQSLWGGDFLTYADDYLDDNEEFLELDVTAEEFYYNVALNRRDMVAFKAVNPSFAYIECEEPCLKKAHYHAVNGKYYGAQMEQPREIEEAGAFGSKGCAPPFYLLEAWRKLERMNPENTKVIEAAVERAGEVFIPLSEAVKQAPPKPTVNDRVPRQSVSSDTSDERKVKKSDKRMEGAEALKKFIDNPYVTWDEVLTLFRSPKSAKWATPELLTSSKTDQKRKKGQWATNFNNTILPLLEGNGVHITELLDTVWREDRTEEKIVACYYMRRLVEGSLDIRETRDGFLYTNE